MDPAQCTTVPKSSWFNIQGLLKGSVWPCLISKAIDHSCLFEYRSHQTFFLVRSSYLVFGPISGALFLPSASRTMAAEATFWQQYSSASGNWGRVGKPKTPFIKWSKRRRAGGSSWMLVCPHPEQYRLALPTSMLLRKWAKRTHYDIN